MILQLLPLLLIILCRCRHPPGAEAPIHAATFDKHATNEDSTVHTNAPTVAIVSAQPHMSANPGAPYAANMHSVLPVTCDAQIAVYNAAQHEVVHDTDEPQVATRSVAVTGGVHLSIPDVSFEN
ncbi:unnamed protein product [Cuscuta europaea]|uniref:Uncharacterized protein n=1 Tax=Cuscuta europaea TaxID=41803 RepID=A0A9P0ZXG8_CUSEU|nr:unnamed protein product [Cuscuta europaea]